MTTFACRSRDASGSVVERTIEAGSENEALMLLEDDGLFPIEIKEAGDGRRRPESSPRAAKDTGARISRGRRVKSKDLLRFSMQLSSSIDAGVPLLTAVGSIRRQADNPRFKAMLADMIVDIESGLSLSGAMRNHPKTFSEAYTNTIAAGEESGSLDQVLNNLAEHLEAEMEVLSDVRSALMYPTIVIATLGLAVSVLIIFVVPRFASFYSGFDAELPLPTRILVETSTAVANNFVYFLIALGVLAFGCVKIYRTPTGKRTFDDLVLRIPVIGRLIETAVTLRAVQMIGLFTKAGIAVLQGLETIARTTTNTKMRRDLESVAEGIAAGGTLTDSLEAAGCFPPAARQMLATGEATGAMEKACFTVTKHFKKELHYLTKNLSTLIEPMLTLVLAVVVLLVALAAFLPMWDLVKVVG